MAAHEVRGWQTGFLLLVPPPPDRRPESPHAPTGLAGLGYHRFSLLVALAPAPLRAQRRVARSLLAAPRYTARYMEVMSTLIAEERYVQNLSRGTGLMIGRQPSQGTGAVIAGGPAEQRSRADVLLMPIGPPIGWRSFRDVLEVNENPVRDRDSRLAKLFLEPAESARTQAQRIADESARFNISRMGRWLNEPGLPLVFLQTALQPRFQFAIDKRDGDAWIVKFDERTRPTIFKHNTTLDNPSSGRFWIDPDTGEVSAPSTPSSRRHGSFVYDHLQARRQFGIAIPAEIESLSENLAAGNRRLTGAPNTATIERPSNHRAEDQGA